MQNRIHEKVARLVFFSVNTRHGLVVVLMSVTVDFI